MAVLWLLGEYTLDCVDAYDICRCVLHLWLVINENVAFSPMLWLYS